MSLDFDGLALPNPFLNSQHDEWRYQLRRFFEQSAMPFVAQWDEQGSVPEKLWLQAAQMGILGLGYPEVYGGTLEGIDIWYKNILNQELARLGAGGIGASLMVHNIALPPIVSFASDKIKQAVVPAVLAGEKHISLAITEPGAGSDVAQLTTSAKRDGQTYIVNGCKTYITGGMRANWFTTAVKTDEGVSVLLIPASSEGVSRTLLDKKQGWWCSDTATIYFDQVRVPVENLIGQENQGFKVIMQNFNGERMAMSASMEASARVCIEEAVAWAQQRTTFGKRLADHQVIRHKIADMVRKVQATGAYLQAVSEQLSVGNEEAAAIALLKVQCSETLEFCAREAMQIIGGASYMRGGRVERIYREVRVNAIGGGSEEIMRDLAARQLKL